MRLRKNEAILRVAKCAVSTPVSRNVTTSGDYVRTKSCRSLYEALCGDVDSVRLRKNEALR